MIVQGKTLFDVNQEIIDGVYGYFEAFPEKVQIAIEKQYMVLIENQQPPNWNRMARKKD